MGKFTAIPDEGIADTKQMIDDQIAGHLGINFLGIAAQAFHGRTQGGQVDYAGYTGEILKDDPSGFEG